MDNYRFILSGGGTGGHIYPAIAIANELKRRYPDAKFLFVGAKNRMEMEKVPKAGYEIIGLWISGIQRKKIFKNLLFPLKLIVSLLKASVILRKFKPHLVVGTGGFASGPLVRVAAGKGIPCLLQEQNSYAGITNKWLSGKADKICVAYDGMERFFPAAKLIKTGNPIREHLIKTGGSKSEAASFFGLDEKADTLLILGGSLGAKRINELVEENLGFFKDLNMQLIWQCGSLYIGEYKKYDSASVRVTDFINRMDLAYNLADIIISRAGAGSVSELCLTAKPVLFIPSPNVAEDHQTKNARALVDKSAAVMVTETRLQSDFQDVFRELANNEKYRLELAANIGKLALPDATRRIADEAEALLKDKSKVE